MAGPEQQAPLALLLLQASRWFDRQLLERLEQRGWPRLTSAQSLVFPHLSDDGVSVAGLARALGTTRQSAHELVRGLERLDLVASQPDPASRRSRSVVLTPRGRRLAGEARRILPELEAELAQPDDGAPPVDVAALRAVLGQRDWV